MLPVSVPFLPDGHPFWIYYFCVQCRHDPKWFYKGYENYLKAAKLREAE